MSTIPEAIKALEAEIERETDEEKIEFLKLCIRQLEGANK